MLRSVWVLAIYVGFLGLGIAAPFVLTLGYVWVDTFQPQNVSTVLLDAFPVSLVMGASALVAYVMLDRRSPPHFTLPTGLLLCLAGWVTLTTMLAELPDAAWGKWSWAIKTLLFAVFVPLSIRSRIQIEAFVHVYVLSLAANIIPFGAKFLLSGGGYGRDLALLSGNSGLAEGATLATVADMTIPLALFLAARGELFPGRWARRALYWGLAGFGLFTSVGTFQRTGVIGLLVLAALIVLRGRRKLLSLTLLLATAGLVLALTSSTWESRIATITEYQADTSAMTRILVWRWTFDFANTHPFGGGFEVYRINVIQHPVTPELPEGLTETGRAFHSIYFEVLGEHGWFGLLLFLSMLAASLGALRRVMRLSHQYGELAWCGDLARALEASTLVLMSCGAFIGIAFQPMLYFMVALSVSLSEWVRRSLPPVPVRTASVPGLRAT